MFFTRRDHESHPYILCLTEDDLADLIAELRSREHIADMHKAREVVDTYDSFAADTIRADRYGELPAVLTGPGGVYCRPYTPEGSQSSVLSPQFSDPASDVLSPDLLNVVG